MITQIGNDENHLYQKELGKQLYAEIIQNDLYRLKDFYKTNKYEIVNVIDIGANVGYFSLLASVLFPFANKVLVEPNPENVEVLKINFQDFDKIKIIPKALGDGQLVNMKYDMRWSGSDSVVYDEKGTIQTIGFNSLEEYTKENYILKVDCEGGEKYLKYANKELFANCLYFVSEFHVSENNPIDSWEKWLISIFDGNSWIIHKNYLGKDAVSGTELFVYFAVRKYTQFNINR